MAEGAATAQSPPTFKLVLVGDGGTGKVGLLSKQELKRAKSHLRTALGFISTYLVGPTLTPNSRADHVRKTAFDGRV